MKDLFSSFQPLLGSGALVRRAVALEEKRRKECPLPVLFAVIAEQMSRGMDHPLGQLLGV